ncbi:MAG: ankyrin repeat domain-containing protein [Candidatus Wallbacteria bacterium]|nr:ankyrin repeat domain-containing protein [Candidatus Wallbacteria bacterium]
MLKFRNLGFKRFFIKSALILLILSFAIAPFIRIKFEKYEYFKRFVISFGESKIFFYLNSNRFPYGEFRTVEKVRKDCIANMRTMESGLEMYYMQNKKFLEKMNDLQPYICGSKLPSCPDKGEYCLRYSSDYNFCLYCSRHGTISKPLAAPVESSPIITSIAGRKITTSGDSLDLDGILSLIQNKERLEIPDLDGNTPLLISIAAGLSSITNALLSAEVSLSTKNNSGVSAIGAALSFQNFDSLCALIDYNALITGYTEEVIYMLSKNGLIKQLQMLLENGISPNLTLPSDRSKQYWKTTVKILNYEHVNLLLTPNIEYDSVPPISAAAKNLQKETLLLLLDHGADPNFPDITGATPLDVALKSLRSFNNEDNRNTALEIIRILSTVGSTIKTVDNSVWGNDLDYALRCAPEECCEYLYSIGATPKRFRGNDPSALMVVAERGFCKLAKFLLVDEQVDKTDFSGNTALHHSLFEDYSRNKIQMLNFLLERGADINKINADGLTPLMYASKHSTLEVIEFLIKKGSAVNSTDNEGKTALFYACENYRNYGQIIDLLVANGISKEARDRTGRTALGYIKTYESYRDSDKRKIMDKLKQAGVPE